MIEPSDRITPSDAAELVSEAIGCSVAHAKHGILTWIADEHVRTMSIRAVQWKDAPVKPNTAPMVEINGHMVQPIGDALPRWQWPMDRTVAADQTIEVGEWRLADLNTLWAQAKITVPIPDSGNTTARTEYAGVRFSRSDILLQLDLAGVVQAPAPAAMASHDEMVAWCYSEWEARGFTGSEKDVWPDFKKRFPGRSKQDCLRPAWNDRAKLRP